MRAIPFNQNVWFKFSATSLQYRMEQHFRNIYPNFRKLSSGSFLSAFKFAPECLKFLVERFAFRKLTYYDVLKSVLHVHIRPIDLSITYNHPRVTSGYERFAWVFGTFDKITLRFAMNLFGDGAFRPSPPYFF